MNVTRTVVQADVDEGDPTAVTTPKWYAVGHNDGDAHFGSVVDGTTKALCGLTFEPIRSAVTPERLAWWSVPADDAHGCRICLRMWRARA